MSSVGVCVLNPLITGETRFAHPPGVFGLPGGYPMEIEGREISLDLPEGLSVDATVRVNKEGGRWDGIEDVTHEGEVVVTPSAHLIAMELFGYDANGVSSVTAPAKAYEMVEKFERSRSRWQTHEARRSSGAWVGNSGPYSEAPTGTRVLTLRCC